MKIFKELFNTLALITLISSLSFVSNAQAKRARDIAEKAFHSVVMLVMQDSHGQPVSLGSGFFVKEDVVATNLHVIEGAASGYAKIVGKKPKYDIAGFIAIDPHKDLVLLKLNKIKAPTLKLGDSNDVAVGDEVYAIGNPQGLEGTFSKGIISSIRKVGEDSLLQITAPISPGSSGGPVLNTEGKVVGVSVATFKGGQNLNFAIPAWYIKLLLRDIKTLKPLSKTNGERKRDKSIISDVGSKSTDGVVCRGIRCYGSEYHFSIHNKLNMPIAHVVCLVVFNDIEGEPIDFDIVNYDGVIPAGLAKKVKGFYDYDLYDRLGVSTKTRLPKAEIEFRILDFKIAKSDDLL